MTTTLLGPLIPPNPPNSQPCFDCGCKAVIPFKWVIRVREEWCPRAPLAGTPFLTEESIEDLEFIVDTCCTDDGHQEPTAWGHLCRDCTDRLREARARSATARFTDKENYLLTCASDASLDESDPFAEDEAAA